MQQSRKALLSTQINHRTWQSTTHWTHRPLPPTVSPTFFGGGGIHAVCLFRCLFVFVCTQGFLRTLTCQNVHTRMCARESFECASVCVCVGVCVFLCGPKIHLHCPWLETSHCAVTINEFSTMYIPPTTTSLPRPPFGNCPGHERTRMTAHGKSGLG